MAKRSPAASTIRAETIASVSGILMPKLVPRPSTDLHVDGAADLFNIRAHDIHAGRRGPETLVTFWAVVKPGAKMNFWICASDIFSI